MSKLNLFFRRVSLLVIASVYLTVTLSSNVFAEYKYDETFLSGNDVPGFYNPLACGNPNTNASSIGNFSNPVYNQSAPDPSAIRGDDGKYYVYATGGVLLSSSDMSSWKKVDDNWNLKGAPSDAGGARWAPDVAKVGGKYVLTYTIPTGTPEHPGGGSPKIAYAIGSSAGGAFTYKGKLDLPYAFNIDSHIFVDDDGKIWLYWGGGAINVIQLKLSGDDLTTAGGSKQLLTKGGVGSSATIEGAWVYKHNGWYYLMYSQGHYDIKDGAPNYRVLIARSKSPDGGFAPNKSMKPILEGNSSIKFPGHNSVVSDSTGNEIIVYHGYTGNDKTTRKMMIDAITYKDDWPVINDGTPSTGQQKGSGATTPASTATNTATTTADTGGDGIYAMSIKNPQNRQYHGDDYSPRQSGVNVGNDGYSKQNSIAGIEYAHSKGYKSIDLDLGRSSDGVYFAAHLSELKGKSWAAVDRYNNTRKFKISQLPELMEAAKKNNIQTNVELKEWGSWKEADIINIANIANKAGVAATIKGNGNVKNISDALKIARTHGFWVRTVLTTGRSNGWVPRKFYPPTTSSTANASTTSSAATCCAAPTTATAAVSIVEGGDNEKKAWNFLTGKGLSPEQTAGIMGSIAIEAPGFDPKASNKGNYIGIAQWDSKGRWPALVKWAKDHSLDEWSFDTQIQYLYKEATDRKNIDGIKEYNDVPHTAWYWGRYFEIAVIKGSKSETPLTNVQALGERTKAAEGILTKYKGTTGSSNISTASASCSGDSASSGDASCSNVDAKPPDDFALTTFPGTDDKTDKRTLYLVNVANSCLKELGEKPIVVSQGSYCSPNCAAASRASHNKGATLDISTRAVGGKDKIMKLLKVLREVGFAAWYRDGGDPGGQFAGNEHIHAVALGPPLTGPNAPGSTDQLILYCTGGDGLKGGQKDRWLGVVGRPLPKWAESVKPDCKSQVVRSV